MAKRKIPQFTSLRQEREFLQTHDVFEEFGDDGWQVAEAAEVQVESVFVSRVDCRGATLRVPGEVLARMGAKPGSRVRARLEGRKLVIESD